MSKTDVRVRKSLSALTGKDQRRGYFYCLKMLGILPPPPNSGFEKFTHYPPPNSNKLAKDKDLYTPKCLHDVLIASHATSCEHSTFYFSYYHRHLMILTEIFLNFAHQILQGGEKRLHEIYGKDPIYYQLYNEKNKKLWDDVFNSYNKLKLPEHISNHYWNPTDYKSNENMSVLLEISPASDMVEIDALFNNINDSYPWEINIRRRWYSKPELFKFSDIQYLFQKKPVSYTENEKKFIDGKLDPRLNQALFMKEETYIDSRGKPFTTKKFMYEYTNRNVDAVNYAAYQHYLKSGSKNYLSNSITPSQSQANYGALSKHLQYITKADKETYKLSDDFVQYYNNLVPHYQYARALFSTNMKGFIEASYGGERSHNTIHNNFRNILRNPVFSVTSLIFWPYHSWIDAQIQIKIRRSNGNKENYDYMQKALNDLFTNSFPSKDFKNKLQGVFNKLQGKLQPMSNWQLSGDSAIKPNTAGYYPITEWVTAAVTQTSSFIKDFQIQAGCCARDLALTHNNIRDSFNLNQLYQEKYAIFYESRFWFFKDISKFNYNFEYQVGQDPNDIDKRLGKSAENLPSYLEEMKNIWVPPIVRRSKALHLATDVASKALDKDKSLNEDQFAESESLSVRKLFTTGIQLFATYSPFSENGPNPVYLKLKNIIAGINKEQLSEKEMYALEGYINHGIEVYDIFIFGKESFADVCHKCAQKKGVFQDLDESLRAHAPKIWQYLHLSSLNEFYFQSSNPNAKLKSIYDKLSLVPNSKFTDYRLVNGAQEIVVNVTSDIVTKKSVEEKEKKFLRIDAHLYSVGEERIQNVASKKQNIFNAKFDFYKIFDVNTENERLYFDRYVYKTLIVWVSVGEQRLKFELEIPNFQRLLRLNLHITRDHGNLVVTMTDADYQVKKVYYEALGISND